MATPRSLNHRGAPIALLALSTLAACGADPVRPSAAAPDRVVVLNGFGQTGVTTSTSGTPTYLRFDPFDGATMTVERDTVLSASSAFSGDLVFVADLKAGTVAKIQIPSGSNAAGLAFVPSGTPLLPPGARFLTANRNTGRLGVIASSGSGFSVTTLPNAGLCPYDVLVASGVVWSVDANLECATTFASKGPVRLIRMNSSTPETISLTSVSVGAPRAFRHPATADEALIFTAGTAEFNGTVTAPAAVARIKLSSLTVLKTVALPAGKFGFQARLGENGLLYVTAADGFTSSTLRAYALNPTTLDFVGAREVGQSHLSLVRTAGGQTPCAAVTADRSGWIYCATNLGPNASLVVFDAEGREKQAFDVGNSVFDVALRDQVSPP